MHRFYSVEVSLSLVAHLVPSDPQEFATDPCSIHGGTISSFVFAVFHHETIHQGSFSCFSLPRRSFVTTKFVNFWSSSLFKRGTSDRGLARPVFGADGCLQPPVFRWMEKVWRCGVKHEDHAIHPILTMRIRRTDIPTGILPRYGNWISEICSQTHLTDRFPSLAFLRRGAPCNCRSVGI